MRYDKLLFTGTHTHTQYGYIFNHLIRLIRKYTVRKFEMVWYMVWECVRANKSTVKHFFDDLGLDFESLTKQNK